MRKDWETLALCDRFFDALEAKDYAAVEDCYAPECVVWHSHDCLYQPRADNLAMLKASIESQRKMKYDDRRTRAFEGGFVQQHRLYLTHENGFVGQMDVCFVAYVRNGKMSRIYEYFDTGRREEFLGPQS
jgi:ketosteroid isomerase-like protein